MRIRDTATDESGYIDAFDPIIESLELEDNLTPATQPGLPTDAHGNVQNGVSIQVRRIRQGRELHGLTFSIEQQGTVQHILFAEQHGWNSSSSHEELLFSRGVPPQETEAIGRVDFHVWLRQQTSPVMIYDARGDTVSLARPSKLATEQQFMHQGHRYSWKRARGADDQSRSVLKHHLECTSETGEVYAMYTTKSEESKRHTGLFEVKANDLKPELVELMLMTCMAVYVQLQKRGGQEEKQGIFGKIANSALFSVGK